MTRWIIVNINEVIEKFYPQLPPDQIEEIAEYIDKHWDYTDHRRQIYEGFVSYVQQVNVELVPQLNADRLLVDGYKNS